VFVLWTRSKSGFGSFIREETPEYQKGALSKRELKKQKIQAAELGTTAPPMLPPSQSTAAFTFGYGSPAPVFMPCTMYMPGASNTCAVFPSQQLPPAQMATVQSPMCVTGPSNTVSDSIESQQKTVQATTTEPTST
jgi:hypothetical protein